MVTMPVLTPDTIPPVTVAIPGALLLHVPPLTAWLSVAVDPTQAKLGPVMGEILDVTAIVPVTVHAEEPKE